MTAQRTVQIETESLGLLVPSGEIKHPLGDRFMVYRGRPGNIEYPCKITREKAEQHSQSQKSKKSTDVTKKHTYTKIAITL